MRLVKLAIILGIIILATSLITLAATEHLYSVVESGQLRAGEVCTAVITVPQESCQTCEEIVGVRVSGYDYMVVAYNHPDGHKVAFWIGEVTSPTESWSQEMWSKEADPGSRHSVVIKHLGTEIDLYVDGVKVGSVGNAPSTVTIVTNGVQVHVSSNGGGNLMNYIKAKYIAVGVGVLVAIIVVTAVIRRW